MAYLDEDVDAQLDDEEKDGVKIHIDEEYNVDDMIVDKEVKSSGKMTSKSA